MMTCCFICAASVLPDRKPNSNADPEPRMKPNLSPELCTPVVVVVAIAVTITITITITIAITITITVVVVVVVVVVVEEQARGTAI